MILNLKDLAKEHMSTGIANATRDLLNELQILLWHRSGLRQAKKFAVGDNLKLHLGCGFNIKNGWINIDLSEKAELKLDLREALPFADDSVSIIYSEHFFEHLDYPDVAVKFLRESWRVLKPGGIFSVAVPDCERSMMGYANNDEDYLKSADFWHPKYCNTLMHHVNYDFRQSGEHKYAYDFETLTNVLAQGGFVSITRRSFNPDLDSEDRAIGTLYVDGQKPKSKEFYGNSY